MASIKMDELLVHWLGSDAVYENVQQWIENYKHLEDKSNHANRPLSSDTTNNNNNSNDENSINKTNNNNDNNSNTPALPTLQTKSSTQNAWHHAVPELCVEQQVTSLFAAANNNGLSLEQLVPITTNVCGFPRFFNTTLFDRIVQFDSEQQQPNTNAIVTLDMFHRHWMRFFEGKDAHERFFEFVKQPTSNVVLRDDFMPLLKSLLLEHPGLEFLSSHQEFQDKYALSVITRMFYGVDKSHSGRMTCRQIRHSDLWETFLLVDQEQDINKVTRYFSYEHFYVLYCRFWELDHDRDYKITREDLLKYGDHSMSHMIVDRIFDAAPRPFGRTHPDLLSYEDFIYFMLSEEDKANEISIAYWFSCVDVDGDGKLNNMEMRSFYAVQLHRMQCMGHEVVPFEDMLCQMMDMIKPKNNEYLVLEDFLQPECLHVAGALFDALFNLNKYLMFEQRDPFVERQKREDEFKNDWDRFACIDYNRLAMEEEAREEEAMEIDWVTVDDDEEGNTEPFENAATSEAPF